MTNITASCPICDANVAVPEGTEETEVLTCGECENQLVVEKIDSSNVVLAEAPEIEEDWGE